MKFRITPAGAGKTLNRIYINMIPQDHPRRCGENPLVCIKVKFSLGSPPQVRGKQCFYFYIVSLPRITPAGAGKTHL